MQRSKERVSLGGRAATWAVGALLATVGCNVDEPRRATGEGERKKVWTGRSLAAETDAGGPAQASATALGWHEERVWSGADDWEPACATDPSGPRVYQLTTRYGDNKPALWLRRSLDGGESWEADVVPWPSGQGQNDPQIEVADDGTVFAAWLEGWRILASVSADFGTTWSEPVRVHGPGQPSWGDKPILAVSADGRDVYVAFNASDAYVAASHDGGASFLAPVRTSADGRYWFHGGGAVAPDGTVTFSAANYSQTYRGDAHVAVVRSVDGGTTWTTTRIDTSREMPDCAWSPGCPFGFLGPSAALAVDVEGTVLVAYHAGDEPGAPQRLYARTFRPAAGWSERVPVSDAGAGTNHAFPAVAASRTVPGDFRVAWQDDRHGPGAWNTWLRRSTDAGASWEPAVRLSARPDGAPYKSAAGYAFPYGDYFEIAVDAAGLVHAIWGEGSSYAGPGGSWFTRGRTVDCSAEVWREDRLRAQVCPQPVAR